MTTGQQPERLTLQSTYDAFVEREGIPVIRGILIEDLRTLELADWARLECSGAYINLDGAGETNDAYVAEIAPGKKMAPERHLFEKIIYVLEGRGATLVGDDPKARAAFEWQKGSVLSVPINTWHQHMNGSGVEPARFLAVTTAPITMDLFHNEEFIFNNPFTFEDRTDAGPQYRGQGKMWLDNMGVLSVWESNFIPDVATFQTTTKKEAARPMSSVMLELAHNTLCAHVGEFPVAVYERAHRHGPGAHVIIVSGGGYSLMWPSSGGVESRQRVDWKPGSLMIPPPGWFHQDFNTGAEPARYLAMRWGSQRYAFRLGFETERSQAITDGQAVREVDFNDEDPAIHDMFEAEIAKVGLESEMYQDIPRLRGKGRS